MTHLYRPCAKFGNTSFVTNLLTAFVFMLLCFPLPASEPASEPGQAMLIGTFHFKDAGLAGHERVYSFDNRDVEWQAEAMFEYANIQKLAGPGERVIAIGGSGHMAILKQLLAIDRRLEGVTVDPYF